MYFSSHLILRNHWTSQVRKFAKELSLRQSSGMENFSLNRLDLVEVGETEAKIYDGDVSANSAGDGACESGAWAKILRESTIQLLGGCLFTPLLPLPSTLSVLINTMPNSVSTTQKCLLRHTSMMSVGQLLLSMGCLTGLQVWCKWRLSPICCCMCRMCVNASWVELCWRAICCAWYDNHFKVQKQ